jgi:hypothetical protein
VNPTRPQTGPELPLDHVFGNPLTSEATYAKTWKLMGKMTAEEPSEEANGY